MTTTTRNDFVETIVYNFTDEEVKTAYGVTVSELENGAWNQSLEMVYNELIAEEETEIEFELKKKYGDGVVTALMSYYDDLEDVETYADRVYKIYADNLDEFGFAYASKFNTIDTNNELICKFFDFESYAEQVLTECNYSIVNDVYYIWWD